MSIESWTVEGCKVAQLHQASFKVNFEPTHYNYLNVMVEEDCERILDDWSTVDENCTSETILAALTARLVEALRDLRIQTLQGN